MQFKNKSKSLDYRFLRSSPKLENIVEGCSKMELNRSEFPFMEEPKNNSSQKKYYGGGNMFGGTNEHDDEDLPNLIVFMLGGIAHNEISALERLYQEKRINHNIIIGATSILTANDFIKQLGELNSPTEVSTGERKLEVNDIELGIMK